MPGKTRSILLRIDIRPAGRLAHCGHNKAHLILKGDPRVVVRPPGPAAPERGYCADCAREMISAAEEQLRELSLQLG